MKLVIHGGKTASGLEVLAFGGALFSGPPGKGTVVVSFGIEWDEGNSYRSGLKVEVPHPSPPKAHYDLVVVEDVRDGPGSLTRAGTGLHPTGERQGDAITVYWAK